MQKYAIAVLGCAAATGLCAQPAPAQSTSQSQQLPPVVVEQGKPKHPKAHRKPARKKEGAAVSREAAREPEPAVQPEAQALPSAPASGTAVSSEAVADKKPATNDTAQLLSGVPGVSVYQAGGVSGLPVVHGMEDERVKIQVNGMVVSAACANHMNPALSYVDPASVKQMQVIAGITPVSAGGDSIGGTIVVESAGPRFAAPGEGVITYGTVSVFGRSNGDGLTTSGSVSAATENMNITYTGAWARSSDYKDGNGDAVRSTLYEAQNHMLSLAARSNTDMLVIQGGVQDIPYQGFVNERMDMTANTAWFLNGRYTGQFDWGKLDFRAYYQNTIHEMDFLSDGNKAKYYMGGFPMPMHTHGENFGYALKAELPQSSRDMLRVGSDFHGFLLDDWWPPVPGSRGMAPNTFWNINGGERYDLGTFIEWERKWDPQWTTLLGVRSDIVWMNTGNVQGYSSMMYGPDAVAFNARDHERTDANFDATALARYEADAWGTIEGGYAMKTRSPNLYERYAWSTHNMAAEMIGWFGDGNSYIGNLSLKPETAHTFSVTYGLHDAASVKDPGNRDWELKITPYYSYVADYIDVNRCGPGNTHLKPMGMMSMTRCTAANLAATSGYVALQFANHDAEIYGVDISGRVTLANSEDYGKFALSGVAGYVHGRNVDTGDSLYHMMPINAKFALEHRLGNWSNTAELQLVDAKTDVEQVRNELQTPGYALVNLRTSYQWGQVRFDAGVENLFDQQYYSPLGGAYLGDGAMGKFDLPVAGMGRTVYAGVTVNF